jgi:H+/Cl- antiporter ClcA
MNEIFKRALLWRMVIAKGLFLTFINMATLLVATMQNWDEGYVNSLRWWNWTVIILTVLLAGVNSIVTFIDKTFHLEGDKIKQALVGESDTSIIKKP